MDPHSVTFSSDDERALRRVRSTGDIEAGTSRSSRTYLPGGHTQRRSEGQAHTPNVSSLFSGSAREPLRNPSSPRPEQEQPAGGHQGTHPPTNQPLQPGTALTARATRRGISGAILTFLGYQGPNAPARKEIIGLVWSLLFALVQFVVIITLLAFSAHHKSPTVPGLSEWDACERPLGAWDSIWLVRVALGAVLAYWGFKRDRAVRLAAEQRQRQTLDNIEQARQNNTTVNPPGATLPTFSADRTPYSRADLAPATVGARTNTTAANLPHSQLYSRLSLFSSLISLSWFLTAHILEYTSVNTCRHTSPHLWWLTFGILCILYLMILEIFLLGLLVFILGPIIYVAWSIVLLCLGRHPLQNPFYIKPEIGKLPKSVVDQIPLVLYIPAPPEDSTYHKDSPIQVPQPVYTYPPKIPPTSVPPRRKRFAFLRKDKGMSKDKEKSGNKSKGNAKGKSGGEETVKTWEDHWEAGEYPFVRLEGNRAACAICLMDFEEPARVGGSELPHPASSPNTQIAEESKNGESKDSEDGGDVEGAPKPSGSGAVAVSMVEEVRVDEITLEDRERLQLEDAGDGAQPLRLLACGHVFHKTCLDPWLIDVSGRCPVCQRPVELPEDPKDKKRRRHNARTNSNNNNSNSLP